MKKYTWLITLIIIVLGIIGIVKYIDTLFLKIFISFLWAGFWVIMYGLATAEEIDDDYMNF